MVPTPHENIPNNTVSWVLQLNNTHILHVPLTSSLLGTFLQPSSRAGLEGAEARKSNESVCECDAQGDGCKYRRTRGVRPHKEVNDRVVISTAWGSPRTNPRPSPSQIPRALHRPGPIALRQPPARAASPIPPGRLAAAAEMGFVSFVGRVLFVAAFLLSAYQEYAPLPFPSPVFSFSLSSCLLAVSFRVRFR